MRRILLSFVALAAPLAVAASLPASAPVSTDAAKPKYPQLRIAEETIWSQKGNSPFPFQYAVTIKAVLADGSHALLSCAQPDANCVEVQPVAPEKMLPDSRKCKEATTNALTDRTCVISGLGVYRFKRAANIITIQAPEGKARFAVTGSW